MITEKEEAVSPVIGVMLMIVVTVIIAAVVSGFAGGYSDSDRKAPTAIISCKAIDNGLLFTHESGEYIDLVDVIVILTNGEETRRFSGSANQKSGDKPIIRKVSRLGSLTADMQINTGNQFFLYANNNGSTSGVAGAYLGWNDPEFYLTTDEIVTYRIIERESGQAISDGIINI
ncbi:type IV pilin [Methanogenium cariaci]|jgi:archaeal type IV pilus assembly protein PilA|uniref:type IV pilin n=1 Tax=Methanogenium cariaci TaxID=2197 RepID=UPI000784D859|nr:type IV pilin N-terminal domain-containing protein [Methanogenium cariaci]